VAPAITVQGDALVAERIHWKLKLAEFVEPVNDNVVTLLGQGFTGDALAVPAVGTPEQGELNKFKVTDPVNARGEKSPPEYQPYPTNILFTVAEPTFSFIPLLTNVSGVTPTPAVV
jgi:hypothetical protein